MRRLLCSRSLSSWKRIFYHYVAFEFLRFVHLRSAQHLEAYQVYNVACWRLRIPQELVI